MWKRIVWAVLASALVCGLAAWAQPLEMTPERWAAAREEYLLAEEAFYLADGEPLYHAVYDYDENDRLLTKTKTSYHKGEAYMAATLVYAYDEAGRCTGGVFSARLNDTPVEGVSTVTYDANGDRIETDHKGQSSRTNAAGLMLEEWTEHFRVVYEYDAWGRRISETNMKADTVTVAFSYRYDDCVGNTCLRHDTMTFQGNIHTEMRKYIFDRNGCCIREELLSDSGELGGWLEFSYLPRQK